MKKITITLTEREAQILFEAVTERFMLKDFTSTEETDAVLHKVDAAYQAAGGK